MEGWVQLDLQLFLFFCTARKKSRNCPFFHLLELIFLLIFHFFHFICFQKNNNIEKPSRFRQPSGRRRRRRRIQERFEIFFALRLFLSLFHVVIIIFLFLLLLWNSGSFLSDLCVSVRFYVLLKPLPPPPSPAPPPSPICHPWKQNQQQKNHKKIQQINNNSTAQEISPSLSSNLSEKKTYKKITNKIRIKKLK